MRRRKETPHPGAQIQFVRTFPLHQGHQASSPPPGASSAAAAACEFASRHEFEPPLIHQVRICAGQHQAAIDRLTDALVSQPHIEVQ
jgi:hypothetical protein